MTRTTAIACHTKGRKTGVIARLVTMRALWRQRTALKSLDAATLRDIGLTADQAKAEARRPIWDVPLNWRL